VVGFVRSLLFCCVDTSYLIFYESAQIAPNQTLPLVQLCMEYEYLVKAKLWGNVNRKCMAFCLCHNKTKNNLNQEKKVSGYNQNYSSIFTEKGMVFCILCPQKMWVSNQCSMGFSTSTINPPCISFCPRFTRRGACLVV
jgi:hypothetical protein